MGLEADLGAGPRRCGGDFAAEVDLAAGAVRAPFRCVALEDWPSGKLPFDWEAASGELGFFLRDRVMGICLVFFLDPGLRAKQ